MDGNHIVVQKPAKSGAAIFTYKHTFAIQLLAVVDADYKFIYVDVGVQSKGVLAMQVCTITVENSRQVIRYSVVTFITNHTQAHRRP